jgi:methyl-accepting chemotaxis protein
MEKLMHAMVADSKEQAGVTGAISMGSEQLRRLIDAHTGMSKDVAVTADRLAQLAEELRALVPKKEPEPQPQAPQSPPLAEGALPAPHVAVA